MIKYIVFNDKVEICSTRNFHPCCVPRVESYVLRVACCGCVNRDAAVSQTAPNACLSNCFKLINNQQCYVIEIDF